MATYNKQAEPTTVPSSEQIAWAAGFLEGEGSFSAMSGTDHRARVSAGQKQREPLERLLAYFGGAIYAQSKREYNMWILRGTKAFDLMCLMRPYMSPRRQGQIDIALKSSFSVPHGSPERAEQRRQILASRKECPLEGAVTS